MPGVTDTQSYSLVIRDMLHAKLVAAPFFATFKHRKSRMLQVQPQNLPYLGTYIVDEVQSPDGDGNAGDIRFVFNLRIGFSVIVQNNDPVTCEQKLDQAYWAIQNTLWRDAALMSYHDTVPYLVGGGGIGNPDNTRIESIERGYRRHVYGSGGLDNETPIGELQYDVTCRYRADFPPVITDDLLAVNVRTGVKPGDTKEEMARRLQTGIDVTFSPEEV